MIRRVVCLILLVPSLGWSADLNFSNLTESDFEDISKEMSGNFMHHSVQGAAPLGDIFGFEVGLVGGQENTPKMDDIVKRSGGDGLSRLAHAGILGVVSVPFGITGEAVLLPKLKSSESEFEMTSLALKLSLNTSLLKVIPFNTALRAVYSTAKFSFQQSNSGVNIDVKNETQVSGLQLLVSPSLPLVEPYAGVGYLNGKNTLSSSGGTIFDPSVTTGPSSDKTVNSVQYIAGVHLNLLVIHLGAEYSNAFGTSTYTGKLAFGF